MRFKSITSTAAGLILSTSFVLAQADQTLTGTVSDAMCGKKHMMQGVTAAKCTRVCVKSGSDYALVVGDKVNTLKGAKTAFDKFAGDNVVVTGKTSGNAITVESIKVAK